MSNWIPVTEALPQEGAPVQFSFRERTLVLRGVFRYGAFASRWSRYLPIEISSWRKLESSASSGTCDGEGIQRLAGDGQEYEHTDDVHGLPAAFAPSWSERPARI